MRIHIPTDDRFGYKECYACGTLRPNKNWHLNRHIKEPKIILHYLCQQCYDQLIWYPTRFDKIKKQMKENKEMVYCACGCGKQMPKYNQFGAEKKYYWASHVSNDVKRTAFKQKVMVQCRCGCGQYIHHYRKSGNKVMYYVNGHYARTVKENGIFEKPVNINDRDPRAQRYNILKLYGYLKKNGCVVNDAICKNSKQVHLMPLDGNSYNIDIENYVVLCSSHKLLKTFRKLTSMPEILAIKHTFYYEFKGGRRRWYQKTKLPDIQMRKVLSQEQGDFGRR